VRLRHVARACDAFGLLQAHLKRPLQVFIKAIVLDPCTSWLHRTRLRGEGDSAFASSALGLLCQLLVAAIVDSDRLQNAQVRQRDGLARTLLIEDVAAISAVVLAIGEGEGSPASHADVAVSPLRRGTAVHHAAGHLYFGGKADTLSLQALVDGADV
jgi:hypothetical protein